MFRLHRSDRLALALILLAAGLGITVSGGSGHALRSLGVDITAESGALTPVRGPGLALRLTSAPTGFSLTGTYEGWISLEEGDLVFRVPEARLRTRRDVVGEQTLVGVRLALARESGTSWTTVEESPLFPVRSVLQKGSDVTIRNVELRIGGVHPWELRDRWPVIVHEMTVRSSDPDAYSGPAWTYVHGTRESMEALQSEVDGR